MSDQPSEFIVVLGKRSVRKTEIPHLELFARAMIQRGKQLITTRTEGVASIIAKAFANAGGTPTYMTNQDYERYANSGRVVAFTDTKYQEHLDQKNPDWRTLGWVIIHNPKATEEAAAFLTKLLDDLGTPLQAPH